MQGIVIKHELILDKKKQANNFDNYSPALQFGDIK